MLIVSKLLKKEVVYPIFVNYGQPSADAQLGACRVIKRMFRYDPLLRPNQDTPIRIQSMGRTENMGGRLATLGLGVAVEKEATLYIGASNNVLQGSLYPKELVEALKQMGGIEFPFYDFDYNTIAEYRDVRMDYVPRFSPYIWDCTKPKQIDGQWNPCRHCKACELREKREKAFFSNVDKAE